MCMSMSSDCVVPVVLGVGVGVVIRLNGYASCAAELHLLGIGDSLIISVCCCFVMSSIWAASF